MPIRTLQHSCGSIASGDVVWDGDCVVPRGRHVFREGTLAPLVFITASGHIVFGITRLRTIATLPPTRNPRAL